MLPFKEKSWAPSLARALIACTLVVELAVVLWLRHLGPLDTAEITALILILVAVIPPNIHVIRLRSRGTRTPNSHLREQGQPR